MFGSVIIIFIIVILFNDIHEKLYTHKSSVQQYTYI